MTPLAFFFSLALLSSAASPTVHHFKKVPTNQFPRAVVLRDFCPDKEPDCWKNLQSQGSVWAGDVNGDGTNELLVFPGRDWVGSAGRWYFLYQKRGKDWVSLAKTPNDFDSMDGWFTRHPRFDILPAVRHGYHDLRVASDMCMKWDGKEYVVYDPADYHSLDPSWFNDRDSREAEIFWEIHYSGQDKITFSPQWFPMKKGDFYILGGRERPWPVVGAADDRVVGVELNDPQENLRWYGLLKGGIWAVRGSRTFFLAPQVSETFENIKELKLDGDWLLGFGTSASRPSIRYNRRTHELVLDPHDYDPD